jgi:hypothetical protein
MSTDHLRTLRDDELLAEVTRLAADERRATARLVAALAELDARRLYLDQGCPSLFVYCTRVLNCPSTRHTAGSKRHALLGAFLFCWNGWNAAISRSRP